MTEWTRRGFIFGAASLAAYGLLLGVERVCYSARTDTPEEDGHAGPVTIVLFADDGTRLAVVTLPKVRKSIKEWKKQLTETQFAVTRRDSTEWAYSGSLFDQHAAGIYRCIGCENAMFSSSTKFESGTGWPSFWAPIAEENVSEKKDFSLAMLRSEVQCKLCDAHLGHLFTDGPEPTGLRYCMNSAALRFIPRSKS